MYDMIYEIKYDMIYDMSRSNWMAFMQLKNVGVKKAYKITSNNTINKITSNL